MGVDIRAIIVHNISGGFGLLCGSIAFSSCVNLSHSRQQRENLPCRLSSILASPKITYSGGLQGRSPLRYTTPKIREENRSSLPVIATFKFSAQYLLLLFQLAHSGRATFTFGVSPLFTRRLPSLQLHFPGPP